jgi:hypothetical protein
MIDRRTLTLATLLTAGLVASAAAGQTIGLELLALGLSSPTHVTPAGDGSGRLFITERAGTIRIFDGAQLLATPFLDITTLVSCCTGEQGMFSTAFHPDYETNGFFYVSYTDNDGDTVIERYTVSGNPNVADPASGLLILAVDQPFPAHNNGQIAFGPDGYLYIGMGDGGGPGDPNNNGQSINTLLGKILRVDVDSGTPYTIPLDNPYVGIPGEDEIWAIGLRNPWRFSFDRLTGDLFIGDVGELRFEEINFQPASSGGCENYGWRLMEANVCFNPATNCSPGVPTGCNPTGALTLPILFYAHQSNPCDSVTGGFRYRGTEVPAIAGMYLYADYCRGQIFGAQPIQGSGEDVEISGAAWPDVEWTTTLLLDAPFFLPSFGEDENGELYVLEASPGGKLYKIVSTGPQLAVSGSCPGPVTVTLSNAPPNTEVAVVAAANTNGFTKGGALCNGTRFTIGEPFQLPPTQIIVNSSGNGMGNMTLAPNRCWLQAMAYATCQTSNTVQVP